MNVAKLSPLMEFLAGRLPAGQLSDENWSLMFSEARRAGLLARLNELCLPPNILAAHVPDRLRLHSESALIQAVAFRRDVLRELDHLQRALSHLNAPAILLKGGAYVALGCSAANGRIFSDIDVLVAKKNVGSAEGALMLNGWVGGKLEPYDQRYYREWSHEIPPMTHRSRGTTIDLHHSLVMPTCRIRVDSEKMVKEAVPLDKGSFWWRLKDEDMVLHAICHLMLNSEFERGLRDLWDIDLLFRQFSAKSPDFSESLMDRALDVGLGKMAPSALFLARRFFGTPIADRYLSGQSSLLVRLVGSSSSSRHSSTRPGWQTVSDAILSYREMYLRLPNRLLVVHLAHKTAGWFSPPVKKSIDQVQP